MNLTRDRQGFLEDVNGMTLPQLKELLDRQEKIFAKKKFVANLPDKGEKSRQFAEKLKELIAAKSRGKTSSYNAISIKENNPRFLDESDTIAKDTDNVTIETLVTRNEMDVTYSSDTNDTRDTNPSEELAQQMQELSVDKDAIKDTQPIPTNSYERVIRKVEEDPSSIKTKFLPNRSKREKGCSGIITSGKKSQSTNIQEESAVYPPIYSHESSKLISVEESVQLIQVQRAKAEQLAVERAAQRLAEQFTTKMKTYQPPSVDMSYRQAKKNDNDEDDDSDDGNDDDEPDSDDIPSDEDKDDDGAEL